MELRPATVEDLPRLFELHAAVFRSHVEEIWGWDEAWQWESFRSEVEGSDTRVVEIDGRLVGYLQTVETPERLFLRNLALHPEVQGRGLGSRMVERVQQRAAERGVPVELRVFRTNPRAERFYRRLGFRRSGRTDGFVSMAWTADDPPTAS